MAFLLELFARFTHPKAFATLITNATQFSSLILKGLPSREVFAAISTIHKGGKLVEVCVLELISELLELLLQLLTAEIIPSFTLKHPMDKCAIGSLQSLQ
jgi:hypothetical protein